MNKQRAKYVASSSRGLIFWPALRRVVRAAGYIPVQMHFLGLPPAVWGRLPASKRKIARYAGRKTVLTFEDSFLRSVLPGPQTPPIGITIDDLGVHFDGSTPSRLEGVLKTAPLDDPDVLLRARKGRDFLRHYGISKYNPVPRGFGPPPDDGYVLVIDQVAGDASIAGSDANAARFSEMLQAALVENPDQTIMLRTHPAVGASCDKTGHFTGFSHPRVRMLAGRYNPVDLLEGAQKVYCVSSQMGFEAILLGHKPVVFGMPFYAGWGLSEDRHLPLDVLARRGRTLDADQLFAAVMLEYSFWYNRTTQQPCTFEEAAQQLLAESRHHWDGLRPSAVTGMHMWKRGIVAAFLNGAGKAPQFIASGHDCVASARKHKGQVVVWAGREGPELAYECAAAHVPVLRMEDGFLRSRGLGAELTPAVSLVLDDQGIYYNPNNPSRLETLISASPTLPDFAFDRAAALRERILATGVTKYNLDTSTNLPELPKDRPVILVPGQVEDDASIRAAAGDVCTNAALIKAVRAQNPDAYIIYKPHPDVVSGLRSGAVAADIVASYCDLQSNHNIETLLDACDSVWTMTSLTGFEALLRGKAVTCLGMPFYAGWGLTADCGRRCPRRHATITLTGLIHATLVDYPRYMDPISGLPCRPELIVERLANGQVKIPPRLRVLAKVQGAFAGYAFIWRRGSKRS